MARDAGEHGIARHVALGRVDGGAGDGPPTWIPITGWSAVDRVPSAVDDATEPSFA